MENVFKFIGMIVVILGVIIGVRMCGMVVIDVRTDDPVVTLMKFSQIQEGMTYKQIIEIVGEEGFISPDLSKEDDSGGDSETTTHTWMNGESTAMSVTIQNGKMIKKTQFKLE